MTKLKKTIYPLLIVPFLILAIPANGQSQEITLTWSTDTYIPLNYPGRALPTPGSTIEIVAVPDQPSQNLNYRWIVNDKIQEANSQVLRFKVEEGGSRSYTIKVEAEDGNGVFWGMSPYLNISIREPKIVLRPEEVSLNADGTYYFFNEQEVSFKAEPYFFNISSPDQLEYLWKIEDQEASLTDSATPDIFTLTINQLTEPIDKILSVLATKKDAVSQQSQDQIEIYLTP